MTHPSRRAIVGFALSLGLVAGCGGGPDRQPTLTFEASPDADRYELSGEVVSVDAAKPEAVIAHEAIDGFMDAMTMPFPIKETWAYGAMRPGDRITATLVVDQGHSWLEQIVIVQESDTPLSAEARQMLAERSPPPGSPVPAFTLIDQAGETLTLADYKGQVLVITFIYTRCPLPDYCPLMSTRFADIASALAGSPRGDAVRLLSVSFDTEYDGPDQLLEYGARYVGGREPGRFARWAFASGSAPEVEQLAEFFGLEFVEDQGQFVHSLRTGVVGPRGRVLEVFEGNQWQPADVLRVVDEALAAPS